MVEELYCSERCAQADVQRSFKRCPRCRKQWDGHAGSKSLARYCNTTWSMCRTCSRKERRCARCGERVPS